MITNNTVLVLGAGASKPYRLPLGRELTDRICRMSEQELLPKVAELFEACGITVAEVQTFARKLLGSRVKSVDAFIEKQPHLQECGKLVMAHCLCSCEEAGAVVGIGIEDDWYSHLWDRMHAGATVPDQIIHNNLRVITFNYDRSLDYFLFQAIKHTYGLADDPAMKVLSTIPILHLYGSLGPLSVSPALDARAYTTVLDANALRVAASGIRIIPEARVADEVFQKARKWFEWASYIGFMGFGFDPINCERLGLRSVLDWCAERRMPPKQILASTLGLTPVEIETAMQRTCPNYGWAHLPHNCLSFLRHTDLL